MFIFRHRNNQTAETDREKAVKELARVYQSAGGLDTRYKKHARSALLKASRNYNTIVTERDVMEFLRPSNIKRESR